MELNKEQIHLLNIKGCSKCPCNFYNRYVPVNQCSADNNRSIIFWGTIWRDTWFPDWCPLVKNIHEHIKDILKERGV